jgi:NADH-quinone oxidoreductase subunit N
MAHGSIQPGLAMGLAFMTAGVAFKMAAVPFHYWTPDAYQGSPTPVTAYLSVGPRSAPSPSPCASSSARSARSRPTGCRS